MATGGWPFQMAGYTDYSSHLVSGDGTKNQYGDNDDVEKLVDYSGFAHQQRLPFLPKLQPVSSLPVTMDTGNAMDTSYLPASEKEEGELNRHCFQGDNDDDDEAVTSDSFRVNRTEEEQIFEGGVPSWEEMERRRKAGQGGTKRVKILEHRCEVCGKIFSRKSFLKNHWVTHTHEKPFACPQCDMRFTLASSVKRHLRTSHSQEKQYKCTECGKAYAQAYSLSCHMRTHSDNHPYKCDLCGRGLTGPSHLKRHLELHNKPKEYKCGECDERFMSTEDLRNHVQEEHAKDKKKYFCNECGKSFSKNSNLTYHLKIHSGERPHMCEVCGQRFTLKSHMKRHIKKHHPELAEEEETIKLPHIDADEDMTLDPQGHFRSKPSVLESLECDNDHVLYACGDCGRCFIKEEHLREHAKTLKHTGELDHLLDQDEEEET